MSRAAFTLASHERIVDNAALTESVVLEGAHVRQRLIARSANGVTVAMREYWTISTIKSFGGLES